MKEIKEKEGVYYTQNIDTLPIEDRVFFRQAKGEMADEINFREATAEELSQWEVYKEEIRQRDELDRIMFR